MSKSESGTDLAEQEDTFDPMDPVLQRILQEVLNDCGGIIEEALRAHFIFGIDEVISLTLAQMEALTMVQGGVRTRSQKASLSGGREILPREPLALGFVGALHSFKGYVWWYMLGQGKRPDFASLSTEDFNNFRIGPNWNPELLFSTTPPGLSTKVQLPPHLQLVTSGVGLNVTSPTIPSSRRTSSGILGGVLPYPLRELMHVRRYLIPLTNQKGLTARSSLMRSRNSSILCLSLPSRLTWASTLSTNTNMTMMPKLSFKS